MKRLIPLLLLIPLFLAACSGTTGTTAQPAADKQVQAGKAAYTNISAAELETMLKNKDFVFVNVHVPFEGNIAQTDVSIPYDQIEKHLDQLPTAKDAKIVLYCRSGNMSDIAGRKLAGLGYTNLYNLQGGFNAWKAAGLPLEIEQK